jgi:hypothetical protein
MEKETPCDGCPNAMPLVNPGNAAFMVIFPRIDCLRGPYGELDFSLIRWVCELEGLTESEQLGFLEKLATIEPVIQRKQRADLENRDEGFKNGTVNLKNSPSG